MNAGSETVEEGPKKHIDTNQVEDQFKLIANWIASLTRDHVTDGLSGLPYGHTAYIYQLSTLMTARLDKADQPTHEFSASQLDSRG